MPHCFLIDPELSGYVIGRPSAGLLSLRIQPLQGSLPLGIEGLVIRSKGGTSEIVGSTAACVKLEFDTEILNFTVARDRVKTRLAKEVMRPLRLSRDQVNGALRLA